MDKARWCNFSAALVFVSIMLFIFSPFEAFAFDYGLVGSEYAWVDIDELISYNAEENGFDGFSKQLADEDNGCFYVYLNFYDKSLENVDDDSIILTFVVQNSEAQYMLSINRNGFVNTSQECMNAIDIVYNFDNCSAHRCGGEIIAGIKLKNKSAKALTNTVTCIYSGGGYNDSVLFDNAMLDMYVEPTTKPPKATTERSVRTTTKSSKTTTEKTTKTSGTTAKKVTTTKFSGSGAITKNESTTAVTEEVTTEFNEANMRLTTSTMSRITGVIAALLFIAGIVLIAVCITAKALTKNQPDATNEQNGSNENNEDDIAES